MGAPHVRLWRPDGPGPAAGPDAELTLTARIPGAGSVRVSVKYWADRASIPPCQAPRAIPAERGAGFFVLTELG